MQLYGEVYGEEDLSSYGQQSALSLPSGFCRWIYRDAHSRVSIFILVAGKEQLTSFCIFKISPHVFTLFSTPFTVSQMHSAPKKAEMPGLRHLSTKQHPNPFNRPPPSPLFWR